MFILGPYESTIIKLLSAIRITTHSHSSYNSYGTDLDTDSDGEDENTGTLKCKSESPGATSYRPTFMHSKYGRSELSASASRVDSQMQRYGIQTYNGENQSEFFVKIT